MRTLDPLAALVLVATLAPGCAGPVDPGVADSGLDVGIDAARSDAGLDASAPLDTGSDAPTGEPDAFVVDAGIDAPPLADVGIDAPAPVDVGIDAPIPDAGFDADPICTPLETQACYDGPPGTSGVGPCTGGLRTCAADGASFGPCLGQVLPRGEDCATSIDEDCDGVTPPCVTLIGATYSAGTGAVAVADVAAAGGRVAIVGNFAGTIDFGGTSLTSSGGGGGDAFVAVYDARTLAWARRFGDAPTQLGLGVALDASGGVVMTGTFQGTIDPGLGPLTSAGVQDVFLVRYDRDGSTLFAHRYGDAAAQFGRAVAVDASGIVIAGEMEGRVDFGGGMLASAGGRDVFVAAFDAAGAHVASRRYGGIGDQVANAVALDSAGNVYVAGTFARSFDLGGGLITAVGVTDVFVAAYGRTGTAMWSRGCGSDYPDVGLDLAVSSDRVVVGGAFQHTADFGTGPLTSAGNDEAFVAIYQLDGTPVASRRYGDLAHQSTRAVATDASDDVFMGGYTNGPIDFGLGTLPVTSSMAFVASLDAAGAPRYGQVYGTSTAVVTALAVDGSTLVAAGNFTGSIDLGAGPVAATGGGGAFFIAYLAR